MNEDKIPFDQLAKIGLAPDMVNGFPDEIKQKLANGELSPVINVTRIMPDGVAVTIPMKLQIEQDMQTGNPVLVAYPMNKHLQNTLGLSPEDFKKLNDGEVLNVNGKYLQRDPETNTILQAGEKKVKDGKGLDDIETVLDIKLGDEQRRRAREGKPVELERDNEKFTVGLDLREPQHFRSLKGDSEDWKRQKEIDYDIAHPEFVGIVQTDENRWEKMVIEKEGYSSKTLKERPAMSQNSGMKR